MMISAPLRARGLGLALLAANALSAAPARAQASDPVAVILDLGRRLGVDHDVGAIDELLADGYRLHTGGRSLDREAFKGFVTASFAAVPDWRVEFRILEAAGDRVVALEVITGTHTGEPFAGIPASGRAIGVTNLMVFRIDGGKVQEIWAQLDIGSLMGQLTGSATAPTRTAMEAALDAADAASASACAGAPDTDLDQIFAWERFRQTMQARDASDAALGASLAPGFRLSATGGLDQGLEAVKATFAMASALGMSHDNGGLFVRYLGERYVVAAGDVAFAYLNPTGAFAFPVVTEPKPVRLPEVQILKICSGKVARQYSHADVGALMQQLQQP